MEPTGQTMELEASLFRRGSTTYYTSALFFPGYVRQDVMRLYSFMRVADDYVDSTPQQLDELKDLITLWQDYCDKPMRELEVEPDDRLNLRVTKHLCRLKIMYGFEAEWVDAFLASMLMDANPKPYETLDDVLLYVYGSAEVVGLMMARILRLPKEAMAAAALQGRAMQWINFVRDIAGDTTLGRTYFPQKDLRQFNLTSLSEAEAQAKPDDFARFVRFQLARAEKWQQQANGAMQYIPRRPRVAVQTAADGYAWTARQIAQHPLIVFRQTIKPSPARLIGTAIAHLFD